MNNPYNSSPAFTNDALHTEPRFMDTLIQSARVYSTHDPEPNPDGTFPDFLKVATSHAHSIDQAAIDLGLCQAPVYVRRTSPDDEVEEFFGVLEGFEAVRREAEFKNGNLQTVSGWGIAARVSEVRHCNFSSRKIHESQLIPVDDPMFYMELHEDRFDDHLRYARGRLDHADPTQRAGWDLIHLARRMDTSRPRKLAKAVIKHLDNQVYEQNSKLVQDVESLLGLGFEPVRYRITTPRIYSIRGPIYDKDGNPAPCDDKKIDVSPTHVFGNNRLIDGKMIGALVLPLPDTAKLRPFLALTPTARPVEPKLIALEDIHRISKA